MPRYLLLPLLLGACAMPDMSRLMPDFSADPGRTLSQPGLPLPAATAAPSSDPVAAFAASATPGQQGMAGNEPARLRRSFNAASGRECREVLLGGGFSERAQIACRQPDGSFASARPLLQGSGR